jgi:hypothetical protein
MVLSTPVPIPPWYKGAGWVSLFDVRGHSADGAPRQAVSRICIDCAPNSLTLLALASTRESSAFWRARRRGAVLDIACQPGVHSGLMKRPFGVTASAVFALLGSLAMVAFFVLIGVTTFISKGPPMPPQARFGLPMALAMFGVLGTWGITTAIGLFRLRNWARISTVVFSVFLAFGGLVTAPVMLFVPPPPSAGQDFRAVMWVIAAVYGALGLLGSFWLYYFNRRATRQLFSGTAPAESGRPLSISIIGWWMLITGLIAPVGGLLRMPATIFLWILTGWAAVALDLLCGSLSAYIGYGLLRMKPLARVAAICWFGFAAVNSAVFYLVPGREARFAKLISGFSFGPQPPSPVHFPVLLILPLTLIMVGIPLWLLIAGKPSFEHPGV